jgi:mono/diheme cytochrome c family protein
MPAFGRAGFGDQEIADVLAYVRQWQPVDKKKQARR